MCNLHLSLIEWGLLRPLVQILIHLAIETTQHAAESVIGDVEGIHQGDGVGTNVGEKTEHLVIDVVQLITAHEAVLSHRR